MAETACLGCGVLFVPRRVGAKRGRYCSIACARRAPRPLGGRRGTLDVLCDHCGGQFRAKVSARNRGYGRYCSQTCYGAARRARPWVDRFWATGRREGECLIWTAGTDSDGYGMFTLPGGEQRRVPRLAWELSHPDQPIPPGLFVCHNCPGGDRPECFEPAHLWLGTVKENAEDMVAKGRSTLGRKLPHMKAVHGEAHHLAKLDTARVYHVRALLALGLLTKAGIGRRFDVNEALIGFIARGAIWKHLW